MDTNSVLIFTGFLLSLYGQVASNPLDQYNIKKNNIIDSVVEKENIHEDFTGKNDMIVNEYWLFTRKNPTTHQVITYGDLDSITNSNYDPTKPLKVVAHGWTNNGHSQSNAMITSAYLDSSDVNVIVLDWSVAASGEYIQAVLRVAATAQELGVFVQWLIINGGGSYDSLHLIGYSLGAHLVGNTGRLLGGLPRRVTGLDPAGPLWSNNPQALSPASGQYVEVIHTNILSRGITEPIGHTDYYPNGGQSQPGCGTDNHCSHARSYKFFASSVRTDHFVGRLCSRFLEAVQNNCRGVVLNMGNGKLYKRGQGIYGLTTGSTWPF